MGKRWPTNSEKIEERPQIPFTIKFLTLHPSKNSEIINFAMLGAHITSKYFWGIFICNGPVACRNGILSRIIGQPRAWVIGSES